MTQKTKQCIWPQQAAKTGLHIYLLIYRDVKLKLFRNQSLNLNNRLLMDDWIDSRQSWPVIRWWWVVSVHS